MQKVLLRKGGREWSHIYFLDEIFRRNTTEETFKPEALQNVDFLGYDEDYDFQLRETYTNRYQVFLNIGDFKTDNIHDDFIEHITEQGILSLKKVRYFAIKKAIEKFSKENLELLELYKRENQRVDLKMYFLDICERNKINYPNFVVLEIERFMLLNWMLIHPNNYFRVFVELLTKNIDRILFVDELYDQLFLDQKKRGIYGRPSEFRFEIPKDSDHKENIFEIIKLFYGYLYKKKILLKQMEEFELTPITEGRIVKNVIAAFHGEVDSYDLFTQINHVMSLENGIFAHIPYIEIWHFITKVTAAGISFPLLAHILLSERDEKRFVFRSEFVFLYILSRKVNLEV